MMERKHITIEGKEGTWYILEEHMGYYMLESEDFVDTYIVTDEYGWVAFDDVYPGETIEELIELGLLLEPEEMFG